MNKWTIDQLYCYPIKDGEPDVVIQVSFRVWANDTVSYASGVNLRPPSKDKFIPYADLTEDQVVQWVQETLTPEQLAEIEYALADAVRRSERIVMPPLPWAG